MIPIEPTPAIHVKPDTPISECVALMKAQAIGSVLVTSPEGSNDLVGIFTERDLLRNIELIHTGGYWTYPISSIMTRPVVTVELQHLDQAAILMLEHGFRHLPVVETQAGGHKRLRGVISIRDVLRAKVLRAEPRFDTGLGRERLLVHAHFIAKDPKFAPSVLRVLRKLINQADVVDTGKGTPTEKPSHDLVVMDAENQGPHEIARVVRESLSRPQCRAIFVLYGPGSIPGPTLKALEELKSTAKLELLHKPLNLLALSDAIGRMGVGKP